MQTETAYNAEYMNREGVLYNRALVLYNFTFTYTRIPSIKLYTLNNIGSLEGTLEYYYHATPGEPLQVSPGVEW